VVYGFLSQDSQILSDSPIGSGTCGRQTTKTFVSSRRCRQTPKPRAARRERLHKVVSASRQGVDMIAMAAVRVLLFAPGPFSSREVTARTTRCRLQAVECRSAFMPAPGVAARTSYFETYRAAFASKFSLTRRLASNPRLVTNGPRVARWRDCRPYSRWRNGDSLRAGKCGCSRQWAHPASSGRKACGDDWTTVGGTPDDLGRSQPHVRAAPRGGPSLTAASSVRGPRTRASTRLASALRLGCMPRRRSRRSRPT